MQRMTIYGVSFDMVGKQPIVLLKTVEGNKFLPIWIGHPEAAAILMKLQGASTPRPMTHDLLSEVLEQVDAKCERVSVTELRDNTFYASITVSMNGSELEIDSRPSDALALAVRMLGADLRRRRRDRGVRDRVRGRRPGGPGGGRRQVQGVPRQRLARGLRRGREVDGAAPCAAGRTGGRRQWHRRIRRLRRRCWACRSRLRLASRTRTLPAEPGRIIFSRDTIPGPGAAYDVHAINPDGSGLVNLTPGLPTNQFSVSIDPAGARIAFRNGDGTAAAPFDIWTQGLDGSAPVPLTSDAPSDFAPAFSPDGTQVAFIRDLDPDAGNDFDVMLINVDGSGLRNLTNTPGLDEFAASFSPDGSPGRVRRHRRGRVHTS